MAKHSLYDHSPKMEHDEHGSVKVRKSEPHHSAEHKMDKDESIPAQDQIHARHAHERLSMHHRHMHEHMAMHERHAMEHAHHEHGEHKGELHGRHHTEKKEMHARHESEHKAMHTKHEKAMGATGGEASGEPIEKIVNKTERKDRA